MQANAQQQNNRWAGRLAHFTLACCWFAAFGVPLLWYLLDVSMTGFWTLMGGTYAVLTVVITTTIVTGRRKQAPAGRDIK